jgi:hypothetical protein
MELRFLKTHNGTSSFNQMGANSEYYASKEGKGSKIENP